MPSSEHTRWRCMQIRPKYYGVESLMVTFMDINLAPCPVMFNPACYDGTCTELQGDEDLTPLKRQ